MITKEMFIKLYGSNIKVSDAEKRYEKLSLVYSKTFNGPFNLYSSSGRIEILGNHTDHNNGLVLTASISLDKIAAANKSNTDFINIKSEGFSDIIVDINKIEIDAKNYGSSSALVMGIIHGFLHNNYKVGGINAVILSNVLNGSGVSSSASFELLVCEILNDLYNDGKISPVEMAKISQFAENVYFGKPCGLLDQMAIAIGNINEIDFEKPERPKFDTVDLDFSNYSVVLTNTGGSHADLTQSYAAVRSEMESVAKFFGKKVLREVSYSSFLSQLPALSKKVSGRAVLRAVHFFEENLRVLRALSAIKEKDYKTLFDCINKSGDSSYKLLQNCYVPKDVEQKIPLALEISRQNIVDGATRIHGGGFAGTIIAILNNSETDKYIKNMSAVFGGKNILNVNIRTVGVCRVSEE
ncbi:MAG: galactokinase [Firmicutes bacterium]|nr:galactokinase [Bacillota bacterium]